MSESMAELPHRRFVAWGLIAAVAGLVGLVVGVLAWVSSEASATYGPPTASGSPNPTATALAPLPNRYAEAPRMTDSAWSEVDASWDVLVVSFGGQENAPRPRSSYALYATPPGGERRLAFVADDLPDSRVTALAWDPSSELLLLATEEQGFRVAAMRSGTSVELESPTLVNVTATEGLGRASDGLSYVSIETDGDGIPRMAIAAWDGAGWKPIRELGYLTVSPLRGDVVVARSGDELVMYNVVTGEELGMLANLPGCMFASWATDTDFSVRCPNQSGYDDIFGVNLSGEATYLGPAGDLSDLGPARPVLWTGTPLAFGQSESGIAFTVGVMTEGGIREVGSPPALSDYPNPRLIEGSRWALDSTGAFPFILDAARGTLTFTGEGFGQSTGVAVLLPGAQG